MISVRRSQKKNATEFPIIIELNVGELFFTIRAAKELRDKLSSVLAQIKMEATNERR